METRPCDLEGDLSFDANAKPFRLLLIYDSESANREAIYAADLVFHELGETVETDRTTWNVLSLAANATRSRIAEEAARADVILLALASDEPTQALKDWTAQWEQNRSLSGGLLALIPSGDSETGGDLADFLYETAVTANMDFLCQKRRRD